MLEVATVTRGGGGAGLLADCGKVHFWSQCPHVNSVRSWQMIIKHDLTHWFHGQATCCPPQCSGITSVRADVEPAHFWSQGPLANGVRSWQLIIKHDLTH